MVGYMTELLLTDRVVLCIGGGQVAWRKVQGLTGCGAQVTVLAPQLHPELAALQAQGGIRHRQEWFQEAVLDEQPRPHLLFAATGEEALNRQIAALAAQRSILCNSADDPGSSSFLVPAVVRRGAVTVAVTTGGMSPALSRLLKERLEGFLEPGWGALAQLFGACREQVKRRITDATARQHFWRQTCLAVEREQRYQSTDNQEWLEQRLQQALTGKQEQR
ncbi:precorrin-2 dehydrogenase/sirohydrochlorin ferrochelatase family protein [Candidatus Magnetaquicoccus inordinatus]|uniref:precorrin-2 dehydrogenase/sirohydrochlorin ferrochelatase family protein n=1 Tax=Candidatus Magnetaquicoccus inordinatus TaxID=2496818 RepID=UPI00187D1214|nr:bifunctional precorrin-2 dehydrogenase/sirohydrochlorin ferrochelatase [Candidatus Magnetaquicoccus inordinatus]